MKISIIVPVFNSELFLERTINSAINQTNPNWELILIDDGSTDNSLNIINEFCNKDKRIKLYQSTNNGPAHARNIGIKNATGDYIAFLDSDDELEKNMVQEIIDVLNNNTVDVIRYNYVQKNDNDIIKEGGLKYSELILKKDFNMLISDLLNMDSKFETYVWLLVIKREKVILFDENIHYMEDYIYYHKILNKIDNIYFSNTVLYKYYYNELSITKNSQNAIQNYFEIQKVVSTIEQLYQISFLNNSYFYNKMFILSLSKYNIYYHYCRDDNWKKYLDRNEFHHIIKKLNFTKLTFIKKIQYFLIKYHFYHLYACTARLGKLFRR